MKSHTSEFKEEIKTLGKQQSVRITYTLNNEQIILTDEDINSATPNYEASLLKSVMKSLELDSNISIPKDTEIKFEYGLLGNGTYEYLDYGNYIVAKEPEKQEDTLSYKITCYDKMLYSMKDYEHIDITYPCTIKQYLIALCNKIGLQFKDSDFANANRQITNELFMAINEDGIYSSMGYTYRDVLDQIAETTGGCICITLDDKVEVRYINNLTKTKTKNGNTIYIDDGIEEKLTIDKIKGGHKQSGVPTSENPIEIKAVGNNINLFDGELELGTLRNDNGSNFGSSKNTRSKNYIAVEENTIYTASDNIKGSFIVHAYDKDKKWIKMIGAANHTGKYTFTTPIQTAYIRFRTNETDLAAKIKLEKGSTITPYSPPGMGSVEIDVVNKNIFDGNKAVEFWRGFGAQVEFVENVFKVNAVHQSLYSKAFKIIDEVKNLTLSVGDIINDAGINARVGLCTIKEDGTISNRTVIYENQTITKNANAIYFDWSKAGAFTVKEIIVSVNENTITNDYVPHQSQTVIMPIQQEMLDGDYIKDVEHHEWGKIESYNGETITTDYISTTGELTTGATVYYKLVIPVDLELTEEQKTVKNQKLYTYQGATNISIDNELASVDVTYMTEKEQIDEEYISDINVNFGEKYRTN